MELSGNLFPVPNIYALAARSIQQSAFIICKSKQQALVEQNFFPLSENKELFEFAIKLRPLLLSKIGWEPLMIATIVDGQVVIPLAAKDGADWSPAASKAVDEIVESLRRVGEISISQMSAQERTAAITAIADTYEKRKGANVTPFKLFEAVKALASRDIEATEIEVTLPGSQPAPILLPDRATLAAFYKTPASNSKTIRGEITGIEYSKSVYIVDGIFALHVDEKDLGLYKIGDLIHADCVEITEIRMRCYQLNPANRIKPGLADAPMFEDPP